MANETESKRDQLLQVPMSKEEMERLDLIAATLGWSKSAVARHALGLIDVKKMEKMDKIDPPGNRRGVPLGEEG